MACSGNSTVLEYTPVDKLMLEDRRICDLDRWIGQSETTGDFTLGDFTHKGGLVVSFVCFLCVFLLNARITVNYVQLNLETTLNQSFL